jgi:lysophospholipase L1-like esterase
VPLRRALVLALVVLLAGATPAAASAPLVAAVGDSLLGQLQSHGPTHPGSTHAFTRSLVDEGWRASVHTRNAARILQLRGLAQDAVADGAAVVIVSAGSGDVRAVRESADPGETRAAVPHAVEVLLHDLESVCVVWPTFAATGNAGERRTAWVINTALRDAAAERATLVVPAWSRAAVDHPGWFTADGVHLSARGEAVYQAVLVHGAHRCLDG